MLSCDIILSDEITIITDILDITHLSILWSSRAQTFGENMVGGVTSQSSTARSDIFRIMVILFHIFSGRGIDLWYAALSDARALALVGLYIVYTRIKNNPIYIS